MEKIYNFLQQYKDIAFATVDISSNPAIRVFQVMKILREENKLYFATSPHKEVYRELQKNPNIEILGYQGNISVRIKGKVFFDVSDKISQEIYRENSVLPRLYNDYTDLVYFSLKITKADYYDLAPNPPLLKSYDF